MNKIKVNSGMVCLVLLACLFAGWQTMLIVSILLFLFCEVDEQTRLMATRIITFFVGLSLVSMAWDLIAGGVGLITNTIESVVTTINLYRSSLDYISLVKVLTPIETVIGIGNNLVDFLILLTKFFFICAVLTGRPQKENAFNKKVNSYVGQAIGFINNINISVNPQKNDTNQDSNNPV
jgi:hypothetical protein